MRNKNIVKVALWSLLFSIVVAGCTVSPRPLPSIAAARLAIDEADRNEAERYAPAELSIARAKLATAEQEIANKNAPSARRLAEQASIDARYAQVRAQAEKAQAATTENRDTTETVQGIR